MADNGMRLRGDRIEQHVLDLLIAGPSLSAAVEPELREMLAQLVTAALPEHELSALAPLDELLAPVDIGAEQATPLRVLVGDRARARAGGDAETLHALQAALALLPERSLGELLSLDLPVRDHPLFREAAYQAALDAILATVPALAHDTARRREFVELYATHSRHPAQFWEALAERPGFGDAALLEAIRTALQLGSIGGNNPGLVQAIQNRAPITSSRDLTALEPDDWRAMIQQAFEAGTLELPADAAGGTDAQRIDAYAAGIVQRLKAAFPTAYVARAIAREPELDAALLRTLVEHNPGVDVLDEPDAIDWGAIDAEQHASAERMLDTLRREQRLYPGFDARGALAPAAIPGLAAAGEEAATTLRNPLRQAVSRFFANAPSFDLGTTHVDSFARQHAGTAFADIEQPEQVTAQLKTLQRVFRINPDYTAMTALLNEGLDSAHKITALPESAFVATLEHATGGATAARQMYARAELVTAATSEIFAQVSEALAGAQPRSLAASSDALKEFPDLATLFGQVNICDCPECRSVYSPAAYFVDLLQMLSTATNGGQAALSVLLERRPDLEHIKLTCDNTSTALPYVDLVNEILESFVVLGKLDASARENAGRSTEELIAEPEYLQEAAYDLLKQAYYPSMLPFDRPLAATRAYLEQLGSRRYELMDTFRRNQTPSELELAGEYLGLSPRERDIILDQAAVATSVLYGYEAWSEPQETAWVDDDLPPGAVPDSASEPWSWITDTPPPAFGRRAHQSRLSPGMHQHQFTNAAPGLRIGVDDQLFAYVFLDPQNPPTTVMLQWAADSGEHRAYWGDGAAINVGVEDTASRRFMGVLPPAGRWVRLDVPALAVGLENTTVTGMAFTLVDGAATWDRAGRRGAVANVAVFLRRTGLQFGELVELVSTRFVNPGRVIRIDSAAEGDSCSLEQMALVGLDETVLRRMHRLIRLWRTLGEPLVLLDNMLSALSASDIDAGVVQQIARIKQLHELLRVPVRELLSLWAPIDTQGSASLYSTIFLNRAVLNPDDPSDPGQAFEPGPDGSVLVDPSKRIGDHLAPLMAALHVSAAELDLIRADAGLAAATAPLTLPNVSALYRRAALARAVGLSVAEFLNLQTLAGDDPFASPEQSWRFVQLAELVRQSGFSIGQLAYLFRHTPDSAGEPAPASDRITTLASSINDGLARIAAGYVDADDPLGEATRARLGGLAESGAAEMLIRTIDGSATYTAGFTHATGVTFPPSMAGRLRFDRGARLLRLSGPLSTAERDSLLADVLPAALRTDEGYRAAIDTLYRRPRDLLAATCATFVDLADAQAKLLDNQPLVTGGSAPTVAAKFGYLLAALNTFLAARDSTALIEQTLVPALGNDAALIALLLRRTNNGQIAADARALVANGVSGAYFSDGQLATPLAGRIDRAVAWPGSGGAEMPAGTKSARWTALLRVPASGVYRFHITASGAAQLWVGAGLDPLIDSSAAQPPVEVAGRPIELKAGSLYLLRMELRDLAAPGVAMLSWSNDKLSKQLVPAEQLLPASLVDAFARSFTLLHKATLLAGGFELSAAELDYLLDHAADFAGFDPGALPLDRDDPEQRDQQARLLFAQWQRLRQLAALRDSLPPSTVALTDVFGAAVYAASLAANDPRKPAAQLELRRRVVQATGWNGELVEQLVGPAGFDLPLTAFTNEEWLLRLQTAVAAVRRLGVAPSMLFAWSSSEASASLAQDVKRSLKASVDPSTWLVVAKAVNDPLRERQRDALVAYLLPRLGMTSSAQLFEHFLVDVDMSACMPTSRIKQAIASVQLFVQRCQMNLEPAVSPLAIDGRRWRWMKQYRSWEANRKVFLYPENWIEPELRDDRSAFFRELQTELLQSELTPEAAENALLHYLEKVDQVARLEICGLYWQLETDDGGAVTVDTVHVFARTFSTPQIYYYRQLNNRVSWTPWERVSVDIGGDHLIPLVWNRRLYLFWPLFTPKVLTITRIDETQGGTQPSKYWEINLAWSEYKQGKWLPKQVSTGPQSFLSTYRSKNNINSETEDLDRRQYVFRTLLEAEKQTLTIICHRALSDIIATDPQTGRSTQTYAPVGVFVLDTYGGVTALDHDRQNDSEQLESASVPPGSQTKGMMLVNSTRSTALRLNTSADARPARILRLANTNVVVARGVTGAPSLSYALLPPHQFGRTEFMLQGPGPHPYQPFVFQDDRHTYFVMPELAQEEIGQRVETRFMAHYHPYVWRFISALNASGVRGLFALENQRPTDKGFVFYEQYRPTYLVPLPYPEESVDFSYGAAYAAYNWELFFHTPLLIASHLSKNQQWAEAQRWFHYIFDPTDPDPTPKPAGRSDAEWARERYWKVQPFQLYEWDQIAALLGALSYTGSDAADVAAKQRVIDQIVAWIHDPFNPHRIARLRLVAYQKYVVMAYIDNLVGWGDYLFRQFTPESVQEATQLYVLAAELLGPRPQRIPPTGTTPDQTYNTLKASLDQFSNALVELENLFPFSPPVRATNGNSGAVATLTVGRSLYFGIPQNDKLLGYWDTVADRLFKIRHCMNIEGVAQQLPLFAPPLDPGLLTRAAAAGVDLGSVLEGAGAPLPCYRFQYMLQTAHGLCADLKMLGAALLAAIEKRDAEALALLRSSHELGLLDSVRLVKLQQSEEAKQALEALRKTRLVTEARFDFYRTIPRRIAYENEQIEQLGVAQDYQAAAQVTNIAASVAHLIPDFDVGVSGAFGSPVAKLRYGGNNLGSSLQIAGQVLSFIAALHSHQANMASIQGTWKRRSDEWALQTQLAQRELDQIDKQILAAEIRRAIAEQDLLNHDQQRENAKAVDEFMRRKYSSQELYDWMRSQLATIYFQTYQLAFDIAKRTERAYRFERGVTASSFVQFGYWDNLKQGLLAGEQLSLALRRMELAFLEQNHREYEITKHISLVLHDPLALIALKETGRCQVTLPEALFDLDYPGHYFRRIRSVGLSIPAVVGPYTGINATLTLLSNRLRVSSSAEGDYAEHDDDNRFVVNFAAVQSIAISHGQNDSGLFELSFRDERYVPFEGAGAVSDWRIDLPAECNAFDVQTISDVILRVNYTAREGGEALRSKALSAATLPAPQLQQAPAALGPAPRQEQLVRIYSTKHEFPDEWYRFLNPPDLAPGQSLALALTRERFPYLFRNREVQAHHIELFLRWKTGALTTTYRDQGTALTVSLARDGGTPVSASLASLPAFLGGVPHATLDVQAPAVGGWTLSAADEDIAQIAAGLRRDVTVDGATHFRIQTEALDDVVLAVHYSVA